MVLFVRRSTNLLECGFAGTTCETVVLRQGVYDGLLAAARDFTQGFIIQRWFLDSPSSTDKETDSIGACAFRLNVHLSAVNDVYLDNLAPWQEFSREHQENIDFVFLLMDPRPLAQNCWREGQ